MQLYCALVLFFINLPLLISCQTVQDDWTAPGAPDGSTPLQSGTKFTLIWKIGYQDPFATYCPLCDTRRLDLWITSFNGTKYTSKVGRGIDITTTASYDWNVNTASDAFSSKDFWVFRFTFFDSDDTFAQQISSPGFRISGLVRAFSTVVPPFSSASPSAPTSTKAANTLPKLGTSSNSAPQSTEQPSTSNSSLKAKTWISGVVVGPIVGILLGAALMWICLRRRKIKKAGQNQGDIGRSRDGHGEQHASGQDPKENYSQPWQQQTSNQREYIAEVPGYHTPKPPAELWEGNYSSKP